MTPTGSESTARAFRALLELDMQFWHPTFSIDCIEHVSSSQLKIRLPAKSFIEGGTLSERLLKTTCHMVSFGCWRKDRSSETSADYVDQGNLLSHFFHLPKLDEELFISASINEMPDSLPQLEVHASVERDGQSVAVMMGSSTLLKVDEKCWTSAVDPIAAALNRPPRVVPSAPAAIQQRIDDPALTSTRLQWYPMTQSIYNLSPTIPQRYMCLPINQSQNVGFPELNDILGKIGVKPINVACTPMGFVEQKQSIYYFDVETQKERDLVERNFFKEELWSKKFSQYQLRAAKSSFLTLAMPLLEVYQTMLIATRHFLDAERRVDRQQCVADRQQLRRALRHHTVMAIRSALGTEGSKLLRRIRRDAGM